MAEKQLTDSAATALAGTTDGTTGVVHPSSGADPWLAAYMRHLDQTRVIATATNNLRVYEVDSNPDAVGVRTGRGVIGGVIYSYAGLDPAVDGLADNDTTYLWAEDNGAGVLQVDSVIDATGWPNMPHIKLAEVTMAAGVITGIIDRRVDLLACQSAQLIPFIQTQGSIASASRIHIQGTFGTHYLRVRACNSGGYANATNATIAAAGATTLAETLTAGKDLVFKSSTTGLFEIDLTDATAETVTLRTGPATLGGPPADHTATLNVTHA